MRKLTLVLGVAAALACGGPSKEQYAAKEKEAAKYKQAVQDESGRVAALESKVQSLEQQNASLQKQVADVQRQLEETTTAKLQLERTAAKLTAQTAELTAQGAEMKGRQTIRVNEQLLFAENSSKLTPEAKRSLDSIADAVGQVSDKAVVVAAYTDDKEAAGQNASARRWQLSAARAVEVAKYLVARGIDPKKVAVAGFGEGKPVAPNDSIANRALNRRAEVALTPADQTFGTIDVKPATLQPNR